MLVSGIADTYYEDKPMNLMVNIPSGVLVLADGTSGGAPISGINYGIPSAGLTTWNKQPSGIVGNSLQAMMNEFPGYSRIAWDKTAIGSQLLATASKSTDDFIHEAQTTTQEFFPIIYPAHRSAVVYEWDFNNLSDFSQYQQPQAFLSGVGWFDLSLVRNENDFWAAPPTRIETTNTEISGTTLLDWSQVSSSGLTTLEVSGSLPLYNRIYIELSGASYFSTQKYNEKLDTSINQNSYVEIEGRMAHEPLRPGRNSFERFIISRNGPLGSRNNWRKIETIKLFNVDPNAYVRVRLLNFNNKFKFDTNKLDWIHERDFPPQPTIWHLCHSNTEYRDIVQPEREISISENKQTWLAATIFNSERISDNTIEFDVRDTWALQKPDGTALSGIIDLAQVPNYPYLVLLDNNSSIWIMDNYTPAPDMRSYPENTSSPVRIEAEYPKTSQETPGSFTIRLNALPINTSEVLERFRWTVNHHNQTFTLDTNGEEHVISGMATWLYKPEVANELDSIEYTISGTGQYTFGIETMTDKGTQAKTYHAVMIPEKKVIAELPIYGLSAAPSGLAFDIYNRLWITDGETSARLVMRKDVAIWDTEERVLLTHEDYHNTRTL